MRVLHVYAGNLYGGVETVLLTLAEQQHLAPELVHEFALCFDGRLSAGLRAAGRPVHDLGSVRFRWPWTVWRARRRLAQLLRRERYDAIICHSCWAHALFGPVVRSRGGHLIFWAHTAPSAEHWLERRASRTRPDQVVANSRFTAGTLAPLFAGVPTEVLYCPVPAAAIADPPAARRETRAALGVPPEATVILQVSRMERLKGQAALLEALSRLRDRADWRCWIVGGAQRPEEIGYQNELKDQARRLSVADRVQFLGERTDVRSLFVSADVYCQPNVAPDAFGISFVEALYAGLPVVTSALGGALEIVTGDCGILVRAGDSAALESALRGLIDDPAARARLGGMGPARARQLCAPQAVLRRLHALIRHPASQPQAC